MVKLATAREARLYGPALAVRRWEYINAGAYMFGTLLLAAGLAALCASEGGVGATDAGLAVAGVALAVVAAVNAHDLGAHLAGVDCRVGLARFDPQLGIVEFLAPALHAAGCVLAIVGLALQLFSQVSECRPSANARTHGPLIAAGALPTRCWRARHCGCWARCSARARCTSAPTAARSCCSPACRSPSSSAACSSSSPPPSTAGVSPPCQARGKARARGGLACAGACCGWRAHCSTCSRCS
uniref:Uncharacterized protein n=1 Tax=Aegilops tauschii subsp. strangulata TaxID=200361 RepID=A0A453A286_AEGTS